jgi:hypothetical protein
MPHTTIFICNSLATTIFKRAGKIRTLTGYSDIPTLYVIKAEGKDEFV